MDLKNPDLRTSFTLMYDGKEYHIFSFDVICGCPRDIEFPFLYYLYGISYEGKYIPLPFIIVGVIKKDFMLVNLIL